MFTCTHSLLVDVVIVGITLKLNVLLIDHFEFIVNPSANKYKEKKVILQSIGIIVIKSKETGVVAYICRYSSGHLIPTS